MNLIPYFFLAVDLSPPTQPDVGQLNLIQFHIFGHGPRTSQIADLDSPQLKHWNLFESRNALNCTVNLSVGGILFLFARQ